MKGIASSGTRAARPPVRTTIAVQGARVHNLKDISVEIPRDSLVVITGLSGSGKSSLAFDTIYDTIRDLFTNAPLAIERDYRPGRFSFNVKGGRCEECQSEGVITTQLYFMPDVEVTCGACKGARFNSETLEVTVRGKTVDDVLKMSVEEGVAFFAPEPTLARRIDVLNGLGQAESADRRVRPTRGE